VIVTLPWPHKDLSPNSRKHWRGKAPIKAKAREDAAYAAFQAMSGGVREERIRFAGDGPIPVDVYFYPPDRRHRDDDNMIGAMKAARDGLADALGVNDRRFRPNYHFCEPVKPGRIEVVL
jgi:crossover junction endodeoxyribonuclease RusA